MVVRRNQNRRNTNHKPGRNGKNKPDHIPTRNQRRIRGGDIWKNDYFSARTSNAYRTEPYSRPGRRNVNGDHRRSVNRDNRRGRNYERRGRRTIEPTKKLEPIHISKSSIHNDWKSKYGGLIRYYVNHMKTKNNYISNEEIMDDVYQLYIKNSCDLEKVKNDLLSSMDYKSKTNSECDKTEGGDWIEFSIVVEDDQNGKKGTKLKNEKMGDEGYVVKIPECVVGRSYYFEVLNKSPCDLSCEITIDGIASKAAKNAPIPAKSRRTIKPDNGRYFHTHKWSLMPSQRISLQNCKFVDDKAGEQRVVRVTQPKKKVKGKRYNGIRPDYENKRVSYDDYPDPTSYGWTFTGSCKNSLVEFFDKTLNMGTVKLDFYYTTGTVKTTLLHPSTGANQLFRKCGVLPNLFKDILINPRVHTGIGYRTVTDFANTQPTSTNHNNNVVIKLEDDADDYETSDFDVTMEDNDMSDANNSSVNVTGSEHANYFARNDNYDFKTQGHINREAQLKQAMQQPDSQFKKWCKAANTDWACVTAKFYVSIAEKKHRIMKQNNGNNTKTHHSNQPPKEQLPAMTPIADIKSNENVTLSTKFQPLFSNNVSNSSMASQSDRPVLSSNVRMKRVYGLNDDPSCTKSEPIFDCKLYYRAEESNNQLDDDDDDIMDDEDTTSNIDKELNTNNPQYIQELKSAKLTQIQMYHNEYIHENSLLSTEEKQEANDQFHKFERMLLECHDNSGNLEGDLDKIVKGYFDWNMKMQWNQSQLSSS